MDADQWSFHWGTFFVYCLFCFFTALAAALVGVPGLIVVVLGFVVGVFAACRRWFEYQPIQFTDRPPQPR